MEEISSSSAVQIVTEGVETGHFVLKGSQCIMVYMYWCCEVRGQIYEERSRLYLLHQEEGN